MEISNEINLDEYIEKECSLPPPYDIYEENEFSRNTNPYKEQQEAAVRLSGFKQKKDPHVKKLDWIISSVSFVCCLACGIPSVIFTFSACKDAEDGRIIETNRKLKYGRVFAMIAIVTGTVLYTACVSLVSVVVLLFLLRNVLYKDQ